MIYFFLVINPNYIQARASCDRAILAAALLSGPPVKLKFPPICCVRRPPRVCGGKMNQATGGRDESVQLNCVWRQSGYIFFPNYGKLYFFLFKYIVWPFLDTPSVGKFQFPSSVLLQQRYKMTFCLWFRLLKSLAKTFATASKSSSQFEIYRFCICVLFLFSIINEVITSWTYL